MSILNDASGISGTSIANITGNDHNVYYDESLAANSSLGGKTYSLVNGGVLAPKSASSINQLPESLPSDWALDQNFPNPFNASTIISFSVPHDSKIILEVFNLQGERFATLINERRRAGNYSVSFDASNLPSGCYLYRISADEFVAVRKLVLIK